MRTSTSFDRFILPRGFGIAEHHPCQIFNFLKIHLEPWQSHWQQGAHIACCVEVYEEMMGKSNVADLNLLRHLRENPRFAKMILPRDEEGKFFLRNFAWGDIFKRKGSTSGSKYVPYLYFFKGQFHIRYHLIDSDSECGLRSFDTSLLLA